jgi:hypothetical protein
MTGVERAEYTTGALAGKSGLLWAWGTWVGEGQARESGDWRDSFATLGATPHRDKLVHSPLPTDPGILDCARAFAWLATLPGQSRVARTAWTLPQAILLLYYARRLGERLPADYRNQEHYARVAAAHPTGGRTGDAAVAHALRDTPELRASIQPEGYVHGKRRWAIGRMAHYLNGGR